MDLFALRDDSDDDDSEHGYKTMQIVSSEMDILPPIVELGRTLLNKAQEGDTEAVRDLMRQGAPFSADWLGTSPIHWACQLNHYDTAELLLSAGISRDARNKVDRTPLHITATEGNVEILKLLIKYGVEVDPVDSLKMTPLHWAIQNGHVECARLLLDYGANPIRMNKFDESPEDTAQNQKYLEILQLLKAHKEKPSVQIQKNMGKEKNKQTAMFKVIGERERAQFVPKATIQPRLNEHNIQSEPKFVKMKPSIVGQTNFKNIMNEFMTESTTMTSSPSSGKENTMAMLESHGIMLLPKDESTVVGSAVQNGQKVVLTEAGKKALLLTEKPTEDAIPFSEVMKLPQSALVGKKIKLPPNFLNCGSVKVPSNVLTGTKVVTINADELNKLQGHHKIVIQKSPPKPTPIILETAPKQAKVEVLMTKKETIPIMSKSQFVNNAGHTKVLMASDQTSVLKMKQDFDRLQQQHRILQEKYAKVLKELDSYKKRFG